MFNWQMPVILNGYRWDIISVWVSDLADAGTLPNSPAGMPQSRLRPAKSALALTLR